MASAFVRIASGFTSARRNQTSSNHVLWRREHSEGVEQGRYERTKAIPGSGQKREKNKVGDKVGEGRTKHK